MTQRQVLTALLREVRGCTICAEHLPAGPRPIVQVDSRARILIAGQAPGRRVHESGIPFDDTSGDRLRQWMGIDRDTFYDPATVAIVPMGFCYPGTGRSGDLPPRPECAPTWRESLLEQLTSLELTLIIGQYAQAWHLGPGTLGVTETVRNWRTRWPRLLPLPHPSPRNGIWMRKHHWFEQDVLPALRTRVARILRCSTTRRRAPRH